MSDIKHTEEETKGYFEWQEEGKTAAYISYSRAGENLIIVDHTDVRPEHKGKSLGKKLVFHLVEYAREKKIKVMPMCPFATSVFQKEKSLHDVLR